MEKVTIELIALGASSAVNCRPCMEYHLAAAGKLGIAEESLREALDIGLRVSRGARIKTAEYIKEQFGLNTDEKQDGCCG
jgi:AhpD family alkylhydroperoxidase